ncbi:MAG: hypothetical protein HETSPECPRED_000439 [Heterodermia speciosa]|uniref:Uncharacterized protein n=1 Tax=Heterodermia speciosa TaxID=116794 RepID=A0A8H3EQY2_9LECA|nr:MAG: hypothetical protein HETSPECPRED_000439 [Heterodermia speciosa]
MEALKRKVMPRRYSMKEGSTDYHNYEEADEETQKHLEKEFAEAEKNGWAEGKPGSFLNRLISHGNKKTEEELRASAASGRS